MNMVKFEYDGKVYATQGEVVAAIYNAMDMGGSAHGRTTREIAHDIGSHFFGWHPKSKDAYSVKQFDGIIAAIDRERLAAFPCYIPTPALEAIEARAKETRRQFKDRSEWSRALKREADNQVKFARLLHVGKTVQEATDETA